MITAKVYKRAVEIAEQRLRSALAILAEDAKPSEAYKRRRRADYQEMILGDFEMLYPRFVETYGEDGWQQEVTLALRRARRQGE